MSDKKPKRKQGNLDSFFSKKSKMEFKSINHNYCEISNTAALSEAIEPISSALDSSSTSNISPQKDLSKPINSKYDIGLYVNYVGSLPNEEKVSILNNLNNQLKEDILQNRNMLKPIIQTIRLCGRQQFGLRGHQDSGRISMKEPIKNDGNFRCLLRHRAQHGDNTLKKYLETCSSNAMYTSPLIQNEIINIFGELIQSDIIKKISKSNYFSVLADETTDIAQIEQFSICIRYFEEELVVLREDFLTFVPVHDVTGLGLATVLLNTLKELGLDLDKLRGQGYDGAATMSGNFRGVQAIVKKSYPKALYTHCVSHSLNLCLSDAAKTQAIRNSFSIISDCCTFFHSSAKRTTILKNKIIEILPNAQSFKLKSLCETRWVLRHEAVMLFKEFLEPIVAALEQIDCDSSNRTTSLLNTICNFKFLVSVCVSSKLLSYTYHLSEYLQTKNIDLVNALDRVNQEV
ncbi:52 kDa repressor of the inhibitor of the protein kinase-like [Melanaphis sacchari]|uniref:52 kDa repressor of the inhibitor of the protein kinase-like n=1 Tax=Melanaphis sacchari TaxID=742174 RepID=UPI000DC1332A|nr:52 kDa repressor of the inhibitor of the protein kinase-like [Melanaphis sacchari]